MTLIIRIDKKTLENMFFFASGFQLTYNSQGNIFHPFYLEEHKL